MTDVLIVLFVIVLVWIMAVELQRPAGHYGFPFLAAMVFTGFILVQAIGLRNDNGLPDGSLARVIVMSILCVVACLVGFRLGGRRLPVMNWTYDEKRLSTASYILVGIGAIFSVMLTRLPKEETQMSQWTGRPVAYLFFSQCFYYGFAIALLLLIGSKRKTAWVPVLIGSFLYLDVALVGVRRTVAVGFFLTVILAVWFTKKVCLPKWALFACVVIATLGMYSIGDVRSMMHGDNQYASILQGDFIASDAASKSINPLDDASAVLKNGGPEVRNAAHLMASVEEGLNFDFGLNDWNALVFTLVPAQVLGSDFKNALMAPVHSTMVSGSVGGYQADTGTTFCGVGDAFASFWYFGFIKFLFIGWVLGTLYNCAMLGNRTAVILYMVLLTDGLVAVTHSTDLFLTGLAHACIFIIPAFCYAKRGAFVPAHPQLARPPRSARPVRRFPGAMARSRTLRRA